MSTPPSPASDHDSAIELLRQNLADYESIMDADFTDPNAFNTRLQSLQLMADAHLARDRFDDGRDALLLCHQLADEYRQHLPKQPWPFRHLGAAAYKLGALHERLGSDAKRPLDARRESLLAASSWFERGRSSALLMRDAGLMNSSEQDIPDRFSRDVTRCHAALGSLASPP